MTALTNFLIASLVSMCNTLTGYEVIPESSDAQISIFAKENTAFYPSVKDPCISFNEKTCKVLKL